MSLPDFSVASAILLALISGALTVIVGIGWRRQRDFRMLMIAGAFFTHFVKSVFIASSLSYHWFTHDTIEPVGDGFDLVMMVLLFVPFVLRR